MEKLHAELNFLCVQFYIYLSWSKRLIIPRMIS